MGLARGLPLGVQRALGTEQLLLLRLIGLQFFAMLALQRRQRGLGIHALLPAGEAGADVILGRILQALHPETVGTLRCRLLAGQCQRRGDHRVPADGGHREQRALHAGPPHRHCRGGEQIAGRHGQWRADIDQCPARQAYAGTDHGGRAGLEHGPGIGKPPAEHTAFDAPLRRGQRTAPVAPGTAQRELHDHVLTRKAHGIAGVLHHAAIVFALAVACQVVAGGHPAGLGLTRRRHIARHDPDVVLRAVVAGDAAVEQQALLLAAVQEVVAGPCRQGGESQQRGQQQCEESVHEGAPAGWSCPHANPLPAQSA